MKLNTHDPTPGLESNKLLKGLFVFYGVLVYILFGLVSFACFYYAQSFIGGISVILIPIFMTTIILTYIKDMGRAYVEIDENEIHIVDYYWGIKKEKHISYADITSAEICIGYSHQVRGYRWNFAGMRYIVFKKDNKYLFKIIHLPETEEIFKQYIR